MNRNLRKKKSNRTTNDHQSSVKQVVAFKAIAQESNTASLNFKNCLQGKLNEKEQPKKFSG